MSSINQESLDKFRQYRKKILTVDEYCRGLLAHDRNILSQAITLIESTRPDHQEISRKLLQRCLPLTGDSMRIGITGVPGVGKSTFIEAFGKLLTAGQNRLAVLAIDPSSDRSKGSILGDKTRMESLAADQLAFIRPSPSGGSLGGVARKTRETIILCEAAGFKHIIVETVGVGQSETAVHSMVDFFLLLMLSGAGDELQGIKRGIIEMADALAITKADGQNREVAERARAEYQNALHLYPPSESGWEPGVLTCSAFTGAGLKEILDMIRRYRGQAVESGYFARRRSRQAKYWLHEFITDRLRTDFYGKQGIKERIKELEEKIEAAEISSFHAAEELLREFFFS